MLHFTKDDDAVARFSLELFMARNMQESWHKHEEIWNGTYESEEQAKTGLKRPKTT